VENPGQAGEPDRLRSMHPQSEYYSLEAIKGLFPKMSTMENVLLSKKKSLMFGFGLDSWNNVMVWALGIGAAAALVVVLSQWVIIKLQKYEAEEQAALFERFKLETSKQIAEANARQKEAELKLEQLRAKLAPRLITQNEQNELTAALSGFKDQRGTIVASPSTPESEWFARVLGAPLKEAGWDITILPGTPTATILYPKGVVIKYAIDPSNPNILSPENKQRAIPAAALADKLNTLGIEASVIPDLLNPPTTIEIIISERN